MVIALLLQAHSRCSTPARYMLFWFSFLYCFFPFIYHKRASGRLLFWFSFFLFFIFIFLVSGCLAFLSSIYSPNHRFAGTMGRLWEVFFFFHHMHNTFLLFVFWSVFFLFFCIDVFIFWSVFFLFFCIDVFLSRSTCYMEWR